MYVFFIEDFLLSGVVIRISHESKTMHNFRTYAFLLVVMRYNGFIQKIGGGFDEKVYR